MLVSELSRGTGPPAERTMMKSPVLLLLAVVAAPVLASPELAQKKNCMACHAVQQKVIGPSYKDVAAKYAGQADAVKMLAEKIQKGGKGVWGEVPMPANTSVSAAEATQLAKWVLSQK
jgi:cytochrome c